MSINTRMEMRAGVIALAAGLGGGALSSLGLTPGRPIVVTADGGLATLAMSDAGVAVGPMGPPGADGLNGSVGATGARGADGVNGQSVGITAVAAGHGCDAGGVSLWMDGSLPQYVCNGERGASGERGSAGNDGLNGLSVNLADAGSRCDAGGVAVWLGDAAPYFVCGGERGAAGAASTVPGPQGPAGPAGAASTVPGPTGPTGPAGQTLTTAQTATLTAHGALPASLTIGVTPGNGTRAIAVVVYGPTGAALASQPVRVLAPTGLLSLASLGVSCSQGTRVSAMALAQPTGLFGVEQIDGLTDSQGRLTCTLSLALLTLAGTVVATSGAASATTPGT